MVDLAKLDELIARVEKATGPDREIDRALERLTYGDDVIPFTLDYTSSIDDALRLVARVLPDWGAMILSWSGDGRFPIFRMERSYPTNLEVAVEHHTRPLAIILALLKALREASHDH